MMAVRSNIRGGCDGCQVGHEVADPESNRTFVEHPPEHPQTLVSGGSDYCDQAGDQTRPALSGVRCHGAEIARLAEGLFLGRQPKAVVPWAPAGRL